MEQYMVCHLLSNGWVFLGRTPHPGPNLFVSFIIYSYNQEIQPGMKCLHQLPDVEEPIHIIWWFLIFVFDPCAYFLKPHTAHVLIEVEGGSSLI